jgi:hypothetical protein
MGAVAMAGIDEKSDTLLARGLGASLQQATLRMLILIFVLAALLTALARVI